MLVALSAVMRNAGKPAFSLACLHIEHGIRPAAESGGDAAFVRELCGNLKIPCRVVTVPPGKIAVIAKRRGMGIEAAARLFRRRALFQEARRIEAEGSGPVCILTAHTRDDMLETALMRVLQGAGPEGLAAMPVKRGRILRPLLSLGRADVLAYLQAKNIRWREDSTNADTAFLRNRIRHCLVPLLQESFPFWKSGLAALAATQSMAADFIKDEARRRVNWKRETEGALPCPSLTADAGSFFSQSGIIREQALFAGIDQMLPGGKNPVRVRRAALRRFCAGLAAAADLGPLRVKQERGRIVLSASKNNCFEYGFLLLIKEPGLYILKGIHIEVCPFSGQVDSGGFCVFLPLAFRPGFKDDFLVAAGRKTMLRELAKGLARQRLLSAVDRLGTAAFLDSNGLLLKRDIPSQPESGCGQKLYCVLIKESNNDTGGTDA
jgi:tRNA(Ile)-lysidine synthase